MSVSKDIDMCKHCDTLKDDMYRVIISYKDYDNPYAWHDDIEKHFSTLEEAEVWCAKKKGERENYKISSAYRGGVKVDFNAKLLENRIGVANIKQNMIKQLQEKIAKVELCTSTDELRKHQDFLYILIRST